MAEKKEKVATEAVEAKEAAEKKTPAKKTTKKEPVIEVVMGKKTPAKKTAKTEGPVVEKAPAKKAAAPAKEEKPAEKAPAKKAAAAKAEKPAAEKAPVKKAEEKKAEPVAKKEEAKKAEPEKAKEVVAAKAVEEKPAKKAEAPVEKAAEEKAPAKKSSKKNGAKAPLYIHGRYIVEKQLPQKPKKGDKPYDTAKGKLKVTLVKSTVGCLDNQIATVKALGLTKIRTSNVLPDNAATRGMIFKVKHLVVVEEVK